MVDEKHPEDVADRKVQWFEDNDMTPPARSSIDEPADEAAALAEDAHADVKVLSEHYDIEHLASDDFDIDAEISALEVRLDAMSRRAPRYAESLAERLLALEAAKPAIANSYADASSWEALEQHGDFD